MELDHQTLKIPEDPPVKPIVLDNLLAAFALYFATTAVAIAVFVMERVVGVRKRALKDTEEY